MTFVSKRIFSTSLSFSCVECWRLAPARPLFLLCDLRLIVNKRMLLSSRVFLSAVEVGGTGSVCPCISLSLSLSLSLSPLSLSLSLARSARSLLHEPKRDHDTGQLPSVQVFVITGVTTPQLRIHSDILLPQCASHARCRQPEGGAAQKAKFSTRRRTSESSEIRGECRARRGCCPIRNASTGAISSAAVRAARRRRCRTRPCSSGSKRQSWSASSSPSAPPRSSGRKPCAPRAR